MRDQTKVIYPKSKIKEKPQIIHDNGYFSIAIVNWDGTKRVAMRWNGDGDSVGYPKGAFGHPQWLIIPKEVALSYLKDKINDIEILETINMLKNNCP